jgi:hypothetical protein
MQGSGFFERMYWQGKKKRSSHDSNRVEQAQRIEGLAKLKAELEQHTRINVKILRTGE